MRSSFLFLLPSVLLALTGCYLFGDDAQLERPLTKGFALSWYVDPSEQMLLLKTRSNAGTILVDATVVAAGWNDDFIIVKRLENQTNDVAWRMISATEDSVHGDYELKNPSDSAYLQPEDTVYLRDGRWFHRIANPNIPDSIRPDRRLVSYHIVDIRNYEEGEREGYVKHSYSSDSAFREGRKALGVPPKLEFMIMDSLVSSL